MIQEENDYSKYKIFNDPIHGTIQLHPLCVKIIDTVQFQRLRQIKQLGCCYFVYPGASHNRFEHSIGVSHLAGKFARALKERQPELGISDKDILYVEIAGLCHDLGHGPFSHLFDGRFIPRVNSKANWKHEDASKKMFDHLIEEKVLEEINRDDTEYIKELMCPSGNTKRKYKGDPRECLYDIVANKHNGIDVDKWDYFSRDCHNLGISNSFDHNRMMKFARVIKVDKEYQICMRYKEALNVFEMFHVRDIIFRKACHHNVKNIIALMITEALVLANEHYKISGKNGEKVKMSDAVNDMVAYTKLTDNILYELLDSTDVELQKSRDIITNVLERKNLYRYIGKFSRKDHKPINAESMRKVEEGLKRLEDDLVIDAVKFDYGMPGEDPTEDVWFYNKQEPDKAFQIDKEKVSKMLPDKYFEQQIRVYCKDEKKTKVETNRTDLKEWFDKRKQYTFTFEKDGVINPKNENTGIQKKIFNDPIHGTIELHPLCVKIINTVEFQRLRQIKQLGGCYFVYPGASHNRFEHSIGVSHLAGKFARTLKQNQPKLLAQEEDGISDEDILCVEIAGLCHDLGHGPFSHMFEKMFMRQRCGTEWKHEKASLEMFHHLIKVNKLEEAFQEEFGENCSIIIQFIKDLIHSQEGSETRKYQGDPRECLYEIVANKRSRIDVDKWDYFARDCHMLGISNSFDHNRYMNFARVIKVDEEYQICMRDKEVGNVIEMFRTRNSLHRKAYQHRVNKGIEEMIADALLLAVNEGFKIQVGDVSYELFETVDKMKAYCMMTDNVLFKILEAKEMEKSKEVETSRNIITRVLSRKLYKYIGQTSLKDNIDAPKPEDIVKLKEDNERLEVTNLIVQSVEFDYGDGKNNPIELLKFYSKMNPDKTRSIKEEELSNMLPRTFWEHQVRIYCKDDESTTTARKCFVRWCDKNDLERKYGDSVLK